MSFKDTAQYALEGLLRAGADKASCAVTHSRKDEFNIEANEFSLLRTLFNDTLQIKAICGGAKGVIALNKLDKDSIDRAVADCVSLASQALPDDAEDIAEKDHNMSFDQRIGGSDKNALFERTKEFTEQLKDEFPKIVLEGMTSDFNASQSVYCNSNGVMLDGEQEYYSFGTSFSAKDNEKSSSFNYYGAYLTELNKPFMETGLQRTLLEESVKSLNAKMVEGKFIGKIVMTPSCDDMIWQTLLDSFLGDSCMVAATSRWKDALGTRVTDSKLTMKLSPLNPLIVAGERFTADGYLSHDTELIREGILTSYALSLYGSRKTGHKRALNTAFGNIEVAAGDKPLSEIIKGVDRGILLGRFSGGSPGPSGDISGIAKNSFMIENGVVTDALSETMLSFNIVDILQNILSISKERAANGMSILPWCCFDGVTISGK